MDKNDSGRHSFRDAIFLDIPYIIDSVFRRADFALNRRHRYSGNSDDVLNPPRPRSYLVSPPFGLFVLVLFFVAYGPTVSALCGAFGRAGVKLILETAGAIAMVGFLAQLGVSTVYFWGRIEKRFHKQRIEDRVRKATVRTIVLLALVVLALPLMFFGMSLIDVEAFDGCVAESQAWPAWIQMGLFATSVGLAALFLRCAESVKSRILLQAILIAVLAAVLWSLPGIPTRTEGMEVPYPHLYGVLAIGLAVIALLAAWLVRIPFHSMSAGEREPFRNALGRRELFPGSRRDPPLSPRRICGGCVIGILREPLQFLLLPAFAIILVPAEFIWHACVFGLLASALLITAANLTTRWDRMSEILRRYFLIGTPLVASIAVILIAGLRLADVQYVATVLNVAPFGVIFMWTIMAYALFWWFEFQVNGVLAAELLKVFDDGARSDGHLVSYRPGQSFVATESRVERTDRYLGAHAIGQLSVVGWFREKESTKPVTAFHSYSFPGLFAALLEQEDAESSHEMGRRIQLYFALVNLLLLAGLAALFWYHGLSDRANTSDPVITAHADGQVRGGVDLMPLLRASEPDSPPAIVVAASGGGTRAALYTANVLRGLHAIGADRHVVLLSGVSGGGVAAAYFYGHRAALLSGTSMRCDGPEDSTQEPWACFLERMTKPFIRDVLHGATEWRLQGRTPLGILLAESFERRVFADGAKHLGDDDQLGLILNTTVTGHPRHDSAMLRDAFMPGTGSEQEQACEAMEMPASNLAGGRLAFTNVRNTAEFVKTRADAQGIQLPFVLVQDAAVPLARAAALNANFPPVFPNARVNLVDASKQGAACRTRSYYVTDGGATENLGLISALLALKSAVSGPHMCAPLRDVHIVLAEASAIGYDYRQDRGIGAATGDAKERLAGRLTLELLAQVEQALRSIDPDARVHLHDLSLPRVFRSRGGFGTHWMHPDTIRIVNPQIARLPSTWTDRLAQLSRPGPYRVAMDKAQLLEIQQALFDPELSFCEKRWVSGRDGSDELGTVSDWICGRVSGDERTLAPDAQPAAWMRLVSMLRQQPLPR